MLRGIMHHAVYGTGVAHSAREKQSVDKRIVFGNERCVTHVSPAGPAVSV